MTKTQLPGVLLVSLLLVSVAQGGFLEDIVSDTVGSVVGGIFGPTIDNAREGVEAALNEVFDQKITPLVREVEATLDRDLSRVEDDVNRTVAGVEAYITNMVQEVAKEAKEMINSTIDQIRDKLIVTLFDRADKLETKLFKDVSAILDKVLQIVDHVDCTMLTVENSMLDFLRGLLKEPFANPFEKCRKELAPRFPSVKFRWLAVSQMDTVQLFELRKCRLLRSLTPTTPIATIRTTYLELQEAAAKARCAAVAESGVGMPSDMAVYMTRELAQASYIYHIYDDMGHTPHVLTAPRSLRRASAGSCSTPVECYSFALAALQEDRKDIQAFKDLARATHDSLDSITKQLSQAQAPAGTITAFAGSTPPTGWFMCNGQTLLRAQYPALFAAIGETYGKGDGSSTFVLPDLAGRVVVGSGSGAGLTRRALGQTGGEETHTLSIAEMPSHTHGYTASSGTLPQSGSDTQCWVGYSAATTAPAGGNQPHNNMPPFVTLSYIIKS